MQYYHVADRSYAAGDDLLCREALEGTRGIVLPWKWEDAPEGTDRDVVCLFRDRAEAAEFLDSYMPDGKLLSINIPDAVIEADEIRLTTVGEGYDAVVWMIPAEYVTILDA